MIYIFSALLCILASSLTGLTQANCGNGIFKCTSTTTFKICFNGQLVGYELFCKNSTVCCETSVTICSTIPDASCHDFGFGYEYLDIDGRIPNIAVHPGSITLTLEQLESVTPSIVKPGSIKQRIEKPGTSDTITELSNYFESTSKTVKLRTSIVGATVPGPQLPVCNKTGKFPIANTQCIQYLYCVKTTTGFQKRIYICPINSFFNPSTSRCSTMYVCSETTTTVSSNISDKTDGTTLSATTDEPTTSANTSTDIIFTTSPSRSPETSTTSDSIIPNITATESTTSKSSTSTASSISSETTSVLDTTDSDMSTTILQSITVTLRTSTADVTVPVPQLPICNKTGKFPIANTQCIQYLYCVKTTTGFQERIYTCPINSFFNPSTSRCSTMYVCSETTTTVSSNISDKTDGTTLSATTEEPTTSANTSTDIFSTSPSTTLDSIIPDITATPDTTLKSTSTSDPVTSTESTISDLTTTASKSTSVHSTTTVSTTPQIPKCQTQGKFAVPGTKCKMYLLCLATTTGFWSMQYKCPDGSLFDPNQKLCTVYYQCSELGTSQPPTDTTPTITITVPTTTNSATTELSLCQKQGKFPVPNSNCKKYLLCIVTEGGLWGRIYDCLPNTTYDPAVSQCTKSYECAELTSTTTELTVTTRMPECNYQGRIYIPGTGCKQYLLCSLTHSGFKSHIYSCPRSSYFNPEDGRCYSNFECPETKNETENRGIPLCVTIGRYPDPQDTNCQYYYTCSEVSPNLIEGILQKCSSGHYFDAKTQICLKDYVCKQKLDIKKSNMNVISPRILDIDRCFTIGRWEVAGSKCKNYVLCSAKADGSLKATRFTCPTTTVFNQAIQKCTTKYICPDSVCNMPGWIPNPNVKDCSSYISCEPTFDNMGNTIYTGHIKYCPSNSKFDPIVGCDSTYVCPK